ncbi:MAG: riboflavin synthase [Chloroflexota bacterium]|nr:riboflavin synthase [Chloroflexota bacterium]
MFTGIVEEIGTVTGVGSSQLTFAAERVLDGARVGDSIAVNGVCLTATSLTPYSFTVDVMPETLRRTNLGSLQSDDRVNLERAMAAQGRFGGHFVQGHVDGTGRVSSVRLEGSALLLKFDAPKEIIRYIVEKGFIAVDGVSLTVVECNLASFSVSLVGITQGETTLGVRKVGDVVNLEVDIIAKYVEKLSQGGSAITKEFLAEHGFL